MTPWLDDGDVRLYHGDALEVVRQLPDESVDCVVTSPPYWGLRDYGTGEWAGGNTDCDHVAGRGGHLKDSVVNTRGGANKVAEAQTVPMKQSCGKCGARRVDRQMGLEPTPDLFVAGMVELFREIRRVLAPHGTCWVNLGDSYAGAPTGSFNGGGFKDKSAETGGRDLSGVATSGTLNKLAGSGLKPKDLVGIPWRVAFALQADGWWLRSDIIWAKPNPMPESVTDRPTKAHEYIFLLTKQPRYWFDTEAVRERAEYGRREWKGDVHAVIGANGTKGSSTTGGKADDPSAGRNVRTVWQIATQPYPEAHFATYPEELARRCILAGCPVRVCQECGKPSERIVDVSPMEIARSERTHTLGHTRSSGTVTKPREAQTVGWSDCGHNNWRPGTVLDPFIGSGTTAKVARDHQRHAIGIDLNHEYLELAARRLQQLSLLT